MHNEYVKIANDMALENSVNKFQDGGPFGAIIVKDGEIIAKAKNSVLKSKDPTAHAEVNAIREACKVLNTHDLTGCILYTSCYPCPMCMASSIWANIKEIYYNNTKEEADKIGFRDKDIYDFLEGKKEILTIKQVETHDLKAFNLFEENKNIY